MNGQPPEDRAPVTAEEVALVAIAGDWILEQYREASDRLKPFLAVLVHATAHHCGGMDDDELTLWLESGRVDKVFFDWLNEHGAYRCWLESVDRVRAALCG